MPAGRVRGWRADPVVDHPQHHPVRHDQLDVHLRRLGVTGDVAQRFAQRREELGGEIVSDGAVDGTIKETPRFEPERARGLPPKCQHRASQTVT